MGHIFLDRIDIQCEIMPVPFEDISKAAPGEPSSAIRERVIKARAYSRILKVARTIADLDGSERVEVHHLAEAIGYRMLDRGDWAERGL